LNSPSKATRLASASTGGIPIRLQPQFVERVWGAARDSEELAFLYPSDRSSTTSGNGPRIGEVWLTGSENRVAIGPWAGKTLQEVTSTCGAALLGDNPGFLHPSGQPVFPLLVKFLFTTEKLSVQVHPPDDFAKGLGSWGKTEMWHILRAAPGARLAIGFRDDVPVEVIADASRLRESADSGAIEKMLHWQEVHRGETYFVPAGTVHAIGAGIVLCEIQQNSDITYRLYDYNRAGADGKPRPLHVSEAMEVIRPRGEGGRTEPYAWSNGPGTRQLLAACPCFATERWEFAAASMDDENQKQILQFTQDDRAGNRPVIWIALEGSAEFRAGGSSETIHAGEVVIIPADATSYNVCPLAPSVFLRTYPPDWDRDIVEPLRALGKSPEQLCRTIFPTSAGRKGDAG